MSDRPLSNMGAYSTSGGGGGWGHAAPPSLLQKIEEFLLRFRSTILMQPINLAYRLYLSDNATFAYQNSKLDSLY